MFYYIAFLYTWLTIGFVWSLYKSWGDVRSYRIITTLDWEVHFVSIFPMRAILFPISMYLEGRNK